jgi:chromate reductase
MRSVLALSGSASPDSANVRLLRCVAVEFSHQFDFDVMDGLWHLPLYTPQREEAGIPEEVQSFRARVEKADAVMIATPEYLHNIPAVLKNALEWLTTSGQMADKPVLAITFTPRAPRGEHAMRSLCISLLASKARIVAQLPLFRDEMKVVGDGMNLNEEYIDMIGEGLKLL